MHYYDDLVALPEYSLIYTRRPTSLSIGYRSCVVLLLMDDESFERMLWNSVNCITLVNFGGNTLRSYGHPTMPNGINRE